MAGADEDDVRRMARVRFGEGPPRQSQDSVAREEPLEIQIGSRSLAVVMRTPGHDAELALGFLVTERVVRGREDVVALRHCTLAPDPDGADNVIRAQLAEGVEVDYESLRRNLFASASCGICGKATIENALATAPPLARREAFEPDFFLALPGKLRAGQAVFAATGGLHAAALFDAAGECLVVREDVGRHNAVDKVIGWAAGQGRLPLVGCALMVSGRVSYEIVQKALAARIPAVAAISAPSSLAVDLAREARMTLVGFLRDGSFNLYTP